MSSSLRCNDVFSLHKYEILFWTKNTVNRLTNSKRSFKQIWRHIKECSNYDYKFKSSKRLCGVILNRREISTISIKYKNKLKAVFNFYCSKKKTILHYISYNLAVMTEMFYLT